MRVHSKKRIQCAGMGLSVVIKQCQWRLGDRKEQGYDQRIGKDGPLSTKMSVWEERIK